MWLWGTPKPLPEEARPDQNPPDPRLQVRGAGRGRERGKEEGVGERKQEKEATAPRGGGGETGSACAGLPPAGCRWSPQRPPSPQPPAQPLPPLDRRGRLPAPRGCSRGLASPRSRGRASAPRRWLRAGGGRTRRKSCASAASSGAHAAPGAVHSRATRLQVRGLGRAERGRGAGTEAGRPGAAQVLLRTAAALSPALRRPACLGEREGGSSIRIRILTLGPSLRTFTRVSLPGRAQEPKLHIFRAHESQELLA